MNDILVSLFRSIFALTAWATIAICIVVGGLIVVNGAHAPVYVGWIILIGGPMVTVTLSGVVALMIQNNDLLRRIAHRDSLVKTAEHAPKRREPSIR